MKRFAEQTGNLVQQTALNSDKCVFRRLTELGDFQFLRFGQSGHFTARRSINQTGARVSRSAVPSISSKWRALRVRKAALHWNRACCCVLQTVESAHGE